MSDLSRIGVEKPFDMQTAFNDIFTGIAARGFTQAINHDTKVCTYADRHGYRCAVGMLIPDDKIDECVHEGAIRMSRIVQDILNVQGNDEAIEFLSKMQTAHDMADTPNDMRRRMCSVAVTFNVDIPEVDDPPHGDQKWLDPLPETDDSIPH